MSAVAVDCTTTATAWISRVTTWVSSGRHDEGDDGARLGSPVGAMIVVSPVDRNENGMLMTCAIAPNSDARSAR